MKPDETVCVPKQLAQALIGTTPAELTAALDALAEEVGRG